VSRIASFLAGVAVGAVAVVAWPAVMKHAEGVSPYGGQHLRQVSSLSAEDMRALVAGEGWGLAKPAELNGVAGPRHVLDLAEQLSLSPEQRERVGTVFEAMRAEARRLGEELIAAEQALDAAFRQGDVTREAIDGLIRRAERARAALRLVHLDAHRATAPLLNPAQKQRYAELRGYGGHAGHSAH
jgi:Spy/CpxP family protein refolding chaperone